MNDMAFKIVVMVAIAAVIVLILYRASKARPRRSYGLADGPTVFPDIDMGPIAGSNHNDTADRCDDAEAADGGGDGDGGGDCSSD